MFTQQWLDIGSSSGGINFMVRNIRIKDWVTGLKAGDKWTLIPSIRKLQFELTRKVLGQCVIIQLSDIGVYH